MTDDPLTQHQIDDGITPDNADAASIPTALVVHGENVAATTSEGGATETEEIDRDVSANHPVPSEAAAFAPAHLEPDQKTAEEVDEANSENCRDFPKPATKEDLAAATHTLLESIDRVVHGEDSRTDVLTRSLVDHFQHQKVDLSAYVDKLKKSTADGFAQTVSKDHLKTIGHQLLHEIQKASKELLNEAKEIKNQLASLCDDPSVGDKSSNVLTLSSLRAKIDSGNISSLRLVHDFAVHRSATKRLWLWASIAGSVLLVASVVAGVAAYKGTQELAAQASQQTAKPDDGLRDVARSWSRAVGDLEIAKGEFAKASKTSSDSSLKVQEAGRSFDLAIASISSLKDGQQKLINESGSLILEVGTLKGDFEKNKAAQLSASESITQLSERIVGVEGVLNRLQAIVDRRRSASPPEIVVVLDGGEQMQRYGFPIVRHGLIETVRLSLAQYPARRVQLIWNRGPQAALRFSSADQDARRKMETSIESLQPETGEESRWAIGLRDGLNRLSTATTTRRLIYITGRPERVATEQAGDWSKLNSEFQQFKIQAWIIELVNDTPVPEPRLAELASRSGGQYLMLQLRQQPQNEAAESLLRLESALTQALDVIPVVGAAELEESSGMR